jgi:hypothetical protein
MISNSRPCASFRNVTLPMMNRVFHLPARLNKMLARSLVLGTLSTLGLLSGFTPNLSGQTSHLFDSAAYAQSQEPVFTRYVRAAYELEITRRPLDEEVKRLTGGNAPSNVCSNVDQVQANVRDRVRDICAGFATQRKTIVYDKYKLSQDEFNGFQRQIMDPSTRSEMEGKVNAELKRLSLIK